MAKTVIKELAEFGQSIWVDDISRAMIEDGSLKKMIDLGLKGMTSNPTIFDKAIKESDVYDKQLNELCYLAQYPFQIYDALTIRDIQAAADMFLPVYLNTKGLDGFVSLEINPKLSYKTAESIAEVKRLSKTVNRPNVMFKIAATKEGFPAIEECVAGGININVTLIFSLQQYVDAANAYIKGITRFAQSGQDAGKVHSVASVFVSRIDSAADNLINVPELKGKAAVANSGVIYKKYLEMFFSPELEKLKSKGVNIQRLLWGSTSTKNPAYNDVKYVSELIGRNTVNTVPIKTFQAFLDHGQCKDALTSGNLAQAQKDLEKLKGAGVDIDKVCEQLLKDGVEAFVKSFDSLLDTLKEKTGTLCKK
ncbi:MAG: transaldolase [Candidatus Omnitrophica bacterium]|nr:transaldolase [Candidatus Omnitrophota bacterium]